MSVAEIPAPVTESQSRPFDVQRIVQALGVLIFSGTLAVTLIALLARWSPIAEIVSHFRALYVLAAAGALACLLLSRSWRWSAAAAVLALWHGWAIVAWHLPAASAATPGGSEIRVLTVNVNADTSGYQRLLDVIAHENPDMVFVQELSAEWAEALEPIHGAYPFRILTARMDYFGLGLYSRFPIENAESNDPLNSDVPIARADIVIGEHRLHIINAHLAPPEGRALTALRYKQFVWLTEYLANHNGPVLLAGDLNCTMWSPLYADLVTRGHLANARQGHGALPTWYPLPGSLNLLPIDHILGGGGVEFSAAHLGGRIGSDHCPLVAAFRIAQ